MVIRAKHPTHIIRSSSYTFLVWCSTNGHPRGQGHSLPKMCRECRSWYFLRCFLRSMPSTQQLQGQKTYKHSAARTFHAADSVDSEPAMSRPPSTQGTSSDEFRSRDLFLDGIAKPTSDSELTLVYRFAIQTYKNRSCLYVLCPLGFLGTLRNSFVLKRSGEPSWLCRWSAISHCDDRLCPSEQHEPHNSVGELQCILHPSFYSGKRIAATSRNILENRQQCLVRSTPQPDCLFCSLH